MKESCVQRVANDRVVVIREWQKYFCQELGDKKSNTAAALMSLFEHTHNWKIEQHEANAHLNKVRKKHGDKPFDSHLLQWHTQKELVQKIGNISGKNVVVECKKFLLLKGVITEHKNPNPAYGFDNTIYYLFHPEILNDWISNYYIPFKNGAYDRCPIPNNRCPKINNDCSKINNGCPNQDSRLSENKRTITKINSKITTELTTKITDKEEFGKFSNLPTYEEYLEGTFFLQDEEKAEIALRRFVEVTGSKIDVGEQRGAESNRAMVKTILKKNYSVQEICEVIELKNFEWKYDLEMKDYIRPKTIFATKNFIAYQQQVIKLQSDSQYALDFKNRIEAKRLRYERSKTRTVHYDGGATTTIEGWFED